jgi:peptidoglycan/LPS O-acetylase OafA/YrhL
MGIVNGFYVVQIFFGISGFLSTVLTLSYMDKTNLKANYWIVLKSTVARYFR